mgnify:CR=1 FL=1
MTVAEFKDDEATKTAANARGQEAEAKPGKLGVAVIELTAEQKKALKVTTRRRGGSRPTVAALAAGIGPGDVILRVNNADVHQREGLQRDRRRSSTPKKPVALLVRDENGTRFITLPPGRRLKPTLTVLSREYCHLCEDLISGPEAVPGPLRLRDRGGGRGPAPQLEEKWGDKVPVLLDGEREICHYFLDIEAVDARLARMK